jgi:hypothetical protein
LLSEEQAPSPVTVVPSEDGAAPSPEVVLEAKNVPPGDYWLRVHGFAPIPLHSYPFDASKEIVYYPDFFDPYVGRLTSDPRDHLHAGDVLIYYADGGAILYAVATVAGPVEGPIPDPRRGQVWHVPIKRESMLRAVNKAPHAVGLQPPSGWPFLRFVRDYTFIRLPAEDGPYLVEQVRSRASARE